jgi:hypothetical protein
MSVLLGKFTSDVLFLRLYACCSWISRGEETPFYRPRWLLTVLAGAAVRPQCSCSCVLPVTRQWKRRNEQITEESNAQQSCSSVLLTWRTPVPSSPVLQLGYRKRRRPLLREAEACICYDNALACSETRIGWPALPLPFSYYTLYLARDGESTGRLDRSSTYYTPDQCKHMWMKLSGHCKLASLSFFQKL